MKRMRMFLWMAGMVLAGTLTTSCTDYQDEIDALEYRLTVLERTVEVVNNNLSVLQTLVQAIEDGDYITNVTTTSEGYIVTFHRAGAIVVRNGKNGKDGEDGKNAVAPEIGVKQADDGNYYWTINGEWLLASDGSMVRVNGHDGVDGVDGKAIAPQVRINPTTSIWEISTDGGQTWISTGTSATGQDGKDGKDGENGQDGKDGADGKDGKDGEPIITSVTFYSLNGVMYVRFYHANGYFDVPLVTE